MATPSAQLLTKSFPCHAYRFTKPSLSSTSIRPLPIIRFHIPKKSSSSSPSSSSCVRTISSIRPATSLSTRCSLLFLRHSTSARTFASAYKSNSTTRLFTTSASTPSSEVQGSTSTSDGQKKDGGKIIPPTNKIETPTILSKLNPLSSSSTPKERRENIYTIPNILTFSRLLATPAIGYAILTSHPHLALGLFAYAGITDLIDGFLARRFNSQTVLGTIIDPMADKFLMTTVVVCLTLQAHLPVWLAVIILGRDVALAISAIYFRYISLPPPKTFARYWDFSLPSAEVRPTEISKINTFLQLLLVGNAMVLPALPDAVVQAWNLYGVFEGWQYLVATTTVWSGLSYVFNKDAVKILSVDEVKAKAKEVEQKKTEQV